ncbi:hypothetical protein [Winogradskyella sp.]|uniref:hypothetical protein n=1 Tax=Winogradskyella sp. TaxID=1883156 RepID=UPI003F6AF838
MAIQAMNITIKNNNIMRSKREKFKRTLGGYGKGSKTEYNLPKASAKQLKDIAKRLKEEQQLRMIKVIVVTVILFLGVIILFAYSAEVLREFLWL